MGAIGGRGGGKRGGGEWTGWESGSVSQWAGEDQLRGSIAPGPLMPEEPGNRESNRIGYSKSGDGLGEVPGKASRSGVHGRRDIGDESWRSPRGGRGETPPQKLWGGRGWARADWTHCSAMM